MSGFAQAVQAVPTPRAHAVPVLQRKCACEGSSHRCEGCRETAGSADAPEAMPQAAREDAELARRAPASHDFRRIDVHAPGNRALVVGDSDDPAEREADRVADAIVDRAAAPRLESRSGSGLVQRQPAPAVNDETGFDDELEVDEEEELDDEEDLADEVEEDVHDPSGQPKLEPGASRTRSQHRVVLPQDGGEALPAGLRGEMEAGFGRDFSAVRVHTDAAAASAARSLDARAFTVGRHIYFGSGAEGGGTSDGRRLLAHELTHVVQQAHGGAFPLVRRKGPRKGGAKKGAKKKKSASKKKATKPPCAKGSCDGTGCVGSKASAVRSPFCGNESCDPSGPSDKQNFIRHLDVNLKTQMVVAELGTAKSASSSVGPFLSSPHPSLTPKGRHLIGLKCTGCHTNQKAEGMGFYAGFHNGLQIGFHNSQRVAKGTFSHGCVRVPCTRAKWIRDNSWSGTTTVCVHTGDNCDRKVLGIPGSGEKKQKKPGRRASAPDAGGETQVALAAGEDESSEV
jgi:hypothetical protein